jgi:integrase
MAARQTKRLNDLAVKNEARAGRHADGGNLYLVVDRGDGEKPGAKRWVFLFRWEGKLREMGLGGYPAVSLAAARKRAADAQGFRNEGKNPIVERAERELAARAMPTFGEAADEFVARMKGQWRNEKHQDQWSMTLTKYAAALRPMPVDEVDTDDVVRILRQDIEDEGKVRPLWEARPETAARLRGRIERVLDAAKAKGFRVGENPARWRGHLDHLLPKRQKLSRGHHAAFAARLRERDAMAALALEFLILTAARSGEVMRATWGEMDLATTVWTVPKERMKAGREHRVPLNPRAVEILEAVRPLSQDDNGALAPGRYVFPGKKKDAPLSVMAFEMLLRRMKVDVTAHGFRSSFRDWSGEVSSFPREVAEAALAHTVGDQTERAYRRGDALEKRRKMMDAWADFVATLPFAHAAE